jgi:segregation and condensation protein B
MTEPIETQPNLPLDATIEALLFVSPGPVTVYQMAESLEVPADLVQKALRALDERYGTSGGLSLQKHGERYQLTTSPAMAKPIEKFLGLQATSKLSRAALESMAIVAYKQPITRPEIDAIRGVNSDGVIKSLLSKGLITEQGRSDGPGRPIIYETTNDFLQYFGLKSLEELPTLELESEPMQTSDGRDLILKG